jgi:hypothetical protein
MLFLEPAASDGFYRERLSAAPPVSCPSKRPPENESCASGSSLWLRMISTPCSKVHFRLVKKLPGQPPSGAIVPWAAAGAWPKFIKQVRLPAAISFQRPVKSTGGGVGGGGGGGAGLAWGSGRSAATRSFVAHPAKSAKASKTAAVSAARPLRRPICPSQAIGRPQNLKCGRKRSSKTTFVLDKAPHLRQNC